MEILGGEGEERESGQENGISHCIHNTFGNACIRYQKYESRIGRNADHTEANRGLAV